jgi:hypothetical protein
LSATQPTLFDEKSGGVAFCAAAGAIDVRPMRLAKIVPARLACFNVNEDIVASPVLLAFPS